MILDKIDLSKSISNKEYKEEYDQLQLDILRCQFKVRDENLRVVVLFEGWDAAGKGGAIKRLTNPMDPRGFKVYSISAPSEYEKARHYLWRFWTRLPARGEVVIFDRSWYGRVLVERIEKFASKEEWKRAYEEINNFEKMIADDGTIILKYFIHISKDEQKKRFEDRETNPLKKYKIGKDDFRNRSHWDEYLQAYEDMFEKTNSAYAPWNIISGNNKDYARIKIIKTFVKNLKEVEKQKNSES
jgi:polyphosphate kinase 2 (PPK2 family)